MRVRLAHDVVPTDRIPFTAQIAGHDMGRHSAGAHERHERGGEVTAESAAGLKDEVIDRVRSEARRCDGVFETAGAEEVENGIDEGLVTAASSPQLAGELLGALVRLRGRFRVTAPCEWCQ